MLEMRLASLANNEQSIMHANLAGMLFQFVQGDERPIPRERKDWWQQAGSVFQRVLTPERLRAGLASGITLLGLLALKNPASTLLAGRIPYQTVMMLLTAHAGIYHDPATALGLYKARVILELIVGVMLLSSGALLAVKKMNPGIFLGCSGLLFSLTTVNLLLFYFEQFSTILVTIAQFLILLGLLYLRRRIQISSTMYAKYLEAITPGV